MPARRLMAILTIVALSATACGSQVAVTSPSASASATATQQAGSAVPEATPSPVASPLVQPSTGLPSASAGVVVPLADALATMEPHAVWQDFYDLTQIPRTSHHEEQATAFLSAFGKGLGLETITDDVGNVIIREPATPGMEDRPGVVLQAHMDMVGQQTPDSTVDLLTDPISAVVEDGWVHAQGTTLGADDGIGVAIIMALLQAKDVVHGPIEALFTVNEEDGFTGINGLSPDVLRGRLYINVDNEQEGQFLISSAGGVYVEIAADYPETPTPSGMTGVQIDVGGLLGGHSGVDIDKGRGSAHQIMARLLVEAAAAQPPFDVRVASLVGGNARNAIPSTTTVVAAVPTDQYAAFEKFVADFSATVATELAATDPGVTVTTKPVDLPASVMDAASQTALIGAVFDAPQGVYKMSDTVPGLVETSGNLGVLDIDAGTFTGSVYVRSAIDSERDAEALRFITVFEDAGATTATAGAYSSWPPNPDSPLLALMTQVYTDLFGTAPEATAVHAGLETSVAGVKYPDMDMISIGPTLRDVHTPNERLEVASVPKVYDLIVAALAEVK